MLITISKKYSKCNQKYSKSKFTVIMFNVWYLLEGLMEDWFKPNGLPSINKEYTHLFTYLPTHLHNYWLKMQMQLH